MSDFDSNRRWLERELARQLGPVSAPATLWDGLGKPREPRRTTFRTTIRPWLLWPVMTTALLIASCILVWQIGRAGAGLDFRSGDPVAIRNWIRTNSGIDVFLPAATHENVRLLGARLIRTHDSTAAVVDCRISGKPATLLVPIEKVAWTIDMPLGECRHCHAGAHDTRPEPRL